MTVENKDFSGRGARHSGLRLRSGFMTNWKCYKVFEFAEVIGGGTPKTGVAEYWNGDIPWITPKDLSSHKARYIAKGERNISQEGLKNSGAQTVPPDTVLLTSRAPVGYLAIAKNELTTNQGFRSLVVRKGFSPEFVYYLLLNNIDYLKQHASGSTFQELSGGTLKNLEFQIPDHATQLEIAKILGDLDAKIELNQQMNKTLEAMAQALFKEWFVDFRFPGYENAKFIDGLPEGWRMGALGELISIESGKRPGEKSEVITDDFRVPLIGASSVMGYVKDALYKEPILIIGRVGTHGIVQRVSWPAFPSDNTLVIRSKAHEYVYQILRMIDYQSLNVGTTQPLITQTAMKNFVILIPAGQVLEKFEKCVSNLFEKIVANNCETEFLIGLRDFLLPKLFSGYINTNQEA
jgi:type I restriction enzyme S subunit